MTRNPNESNSPDDVTGAWRQIESFRKPVNDSGELIREPCWIAIEAPVILDIKDINRITLYCTPLEYRALATGFMHSSGIIQSQNDIAELKEYPGAPYTIKIQLTQARVDRLKSKKSAEEIHGQLPPVGDTFRLPSACLKQIAQTLTDKQCIFPKTGATHAAGIFRQDGGYAAFAEDVTRHSALDKAIGKMLLDGESPAGLGVMLSGRVNVEMAAKCAWAGIELIAAVSAPVSLALETAGQCNITICGFVRGDRATVFTHTRRIVESGTE